MADYCLACNKLKELNPEFVLNGLTLSMYNSLKNNTGLKPSLGHNNCEDLNDLNDCLLGSLYDKIDAYDICDWREFMKEYLANQKNINAALIASDCGQWEQINLIWEQINLIWNAINQIRNELGDVQDALRRILTKLVEIGVWNQTGNTIFEGTFVNGMGIAGGSINLFGGSMDGSSYIRTNNGRTENDLSGGV